MIDLDTLPLSRRQIDYVVNSDAFVNLAEGSIRAGKTASGLLRWLMFVATAPTRGDLVVCSKTYDTATRNIFNPLRETGLFGPLAKSVSYTRGAPTAKILGRTIEVCTFNDERSEARIRGMTCAGGYVDEWSLMPESFNEQLLGRCSLDGAQLFGNTNPDNPRHWLKTKYIDESGPGGRVHGDWKTWKFTLDDNPALPEKVKARYRRQYTGLWFKRMILGEWCLAEGAVYDMWDSDIHVVDILPPIQRWISLGIDYGTVNPFAGLLLGLGVNGRLYLAREWRWDSKRRQRQLTDREYSERLRGWLDELPVPGTPVRGVRPEWIVVDPSASSFVTQLFRDGLNPALADNSVLDGLRTVASLLSFERDEQDPAKIVWSPRLYVHRSCEGWIEEAPGYSWDSDEAERGEDKPIKLKDHSLDAGRYAIHSTQSSWQYQLAEVAA